MIRNKLISVVLILMFLVSNTYSVLGNANEEYLRDLYEGILGRNPDSVGFQHNLNLLNSGQVSLEGMAHAFLNSPEYKNKDNEALLEDLYQNVLDRNPDSVGFQHNLNLLNSNQVSQEGMINAFYNSPEYKNKDNNNFDFVEDLYKGILERESDPIGFAHNLLLLNRELTRDELVDGFLNSPEYRSKSNEEFLIGLYEGILGRNPDSVGFQHNLNLLNNGAVSREEMINAFINSTEFQEKYEEVPEIQPRYYRAPSASSSNQPPEISGIPDKTLFENSGLNENIIDLWNYASDAETSDDMLNFAILSESNTNIVDCAISSNRYISCNVQLNQIGSSNIIVRVTDANGESDNDEFVVNIISSELSLEITNPGDGDILNGVVNITWIANDPNQDSTTLDIKIEYKYDGIDWIILENSEDNNDGIFSLGTTSLVDADDYKLRITVRNDNGEEISDEVNFIIDNLYVPNIQIIKPELNEEIKGIYTILWEATDNDQGALTLDIKIEYKYNNNWIILENSENNNDGEFIWATTNIENGNYELRLTVKDDDNNIGVDYLSNLIINNPGKPSKPKVSKQHKFSISSLINYYDVVMPGDEFETYIKLKNVGQMYEDKIQIIVHVPDLNIYEVVTNNLNLDSQEVEWIAVNFNVPKYAKDGEYIMKIIVQNGEFETYRYGTFYII